MFLYEVALLLLFVKHWLCDFVWQSPRMLAEKGVYGRFGGLQHSAYHAIGTFAVFAFGGWQFAAILAAIDFTLHYHIDWIKVQYGERDSSTPAFWNHLGLDQLAHYFTYVFLVRLFIN